MIVQSCIIILIYTVEGQDDPGNIPWTDQSTVTIVGRCFDF